MSLPPQTSTTQNIRHGTFAALQFHNYRLWFFGQMISLVGTWMQSTAQGYLIYSLTGSVAYLGIIAFINGVPAWLFTLYGGVIADRISRRTLLILTQIAMMVLALIMAGLVFSELIEPWHVAVLSFLLGIVNAFDAPARQSFVSELVERDYMTNAIALNSTMFNTGTVFGPAIAGITYAAFGPGWCFTINGISFVAVIIALSLMRIQPIPKPSIDKNALLEIKAGFDLILHDQSIKGLFITLAFLSLLGFGLVALVPAWAVEVLHGDVRTNGWLLSARGIGSLAAGLLIATLAGRFLRGRIWMIGWIGLPISWIIFAAINRETPSFLAMALIGFFLLLVANLTNSMVQTQVDDQFRGRIMGIYTLVFFGLAPIGSLIAGFAAEKIGEQWTVAISGMILLTAAIYTHIKMPYLRKLN